MFFEGLTPKNGLRTKRKSKQPNIYLENEIEKWYLRQLAKTVSQLSKRDKVLYDKQCIFVLGLKWRGLADSYRYVTS